MGKSTENKTALSVSAINDGIYADAMGIHSDSPISRDEAFDLIENAKDSDFETLGGGSYLNFDELQPGRYVFIFTGTTSWIDNSPQGQGKTVTAVKLENKEGEQFVCAAKLIVDALMQVSQLPCIFRVDYKGKKKSRSGNNFYDLTVQVGKSSIAPRGNDNFEM